ncbi:MAG TPA: AMP-binding protein, partial [Polyangiaceae bacterium]|nr:AMP-binding protein [Polyangiaceae bacterium]
MESFSLFPAGGRMERVVALSGSGSLSAGQLLGAAEQLAERVRTFPAAELALLTSSRWDGLVGLVAASLAEKQLLLVPARRGVAPALPGDAGRIVSQADATGAAGEFSVPSPGAVSSGRDVSLRPERGLCAVLTSGSTGQPERHDKTVAQLLGEVETQRELLGWGEGDVVLPSVPGHHVYGLLFAVLLPLVSGARLVVDAGAEPENFHPQTFARLARELGATRLVTVPAHLRTLLDASFELGPVRQVVCSGAPLDPRHASEFEQRYGVEVLDVLGSTETGGIALRRAARSPRWSPLPGLRLRADEEDRLWLRSPFAWGVEVERATGDRVKLHDDGTLEHLGRDDGVVKVGAKRTSLQELERVACEIPGVGAAVARSRAVGGLRGEELWMLVESADLDAAQVRAELVARLDAVFVPRRLRVLKRLPWSERGKMERSTFEAAFDA